MVEDELSLRNLIARLLSDQGYRVLSAGSGLEALQAAHKLDNGLDLLLTDVVLPGDKQGMDLAADLLSTRPDLPVLYVSGYTHDASLHAGRVGQGANFLAKPFTAEALARRVRALLDRPRDRGSG